MLEEKLSKGKEQNAVKKEKLYTIFSEQYFEPVIVPDYNIKYSWSPTICTIANIPALDDW